MYRETLPPLEFVLTPDEQSMAAIAMVQLEANRRRQNELESTSKAVGTETELERYLRKKCARWL